MKLEKAFEILTAMRDKTHIYSEHEIKAAESLGIEAMKRIKHGRQLGFHFDPELLPGETDE